MAIGPERIALNRSIAPELGLAEFCELAERAGITSVELRNDLSDPDPLDGLGPGPATRLLADRGIRVASINAVLNFNIGFARAAVLHQLDGLLETARAIDCPALVLCPHCERSDARPQEVRLADTVDALAAYGPLFTGAGVLGYVEPLGYPYSSLSSLGVAQAAVEKSGFGCYRLLYDTFHNFIGPEGARPATGGYDVSLLGLVHVSGVTPPAEKQALRDQDRGLVGPDDLLENGRQVRELLRLGYRGAFSLEPFLASVQQLGMAEKVSALKESVGFLSACG